MESIISSANEERIDQRPHCKWRVTEKLSNGGTTSRDCGSEDRIFNIQGKGKYVNRQRETPVCAKHLGDAWREWKVDRADPINPPLKGLP